MAQTIQDSMEEHLGPGEISSRRSDVWSHFVVSKDGEGKDITICRNCQKSLGGETKNGTSHLNRHLRICRRRELRDGPRTKQPRQELSAYGRPSAESSVAQPAQGSRSVPDHESSLAQDGSSWFNQEECYAELVRMIAFHGYPSSIVDDECFRSLVRGLNPDFQMPSRCAVEGTCHSFTKDSMNELKETLARCPGQISLTTGVAKTDEGRYLYMACQFIDDEWALQKRIMQVFKMVAHLPRNYISLLGAEEVCLDLPERIQKQVLIPGTISSKLEEAVRGWGLHQGRLFSVAWGKQLESCLERKDFLDSVCPFIPVGEGSIEIPVLLCVTYTSDVLDSIGETFLLSLNTLFEQDCLRTVKGLHLSHERRTQIFSELGLNHVERYFKRWYTYYCALEVLHKEYLGNNEALLEQPKLNTYQIVELLKRLTDIEIEAKVEHLKKPPKLKESVFTDLLRKILGTIYSAFKIISSPSGPTANICLEELMKLRAVLQAEANDASTVLAKAVAYAKLGCFKSDDRDADVVLREVQDVLDKHIKEAYLYLSVPAVLDPRFKMEYVTVVLNEVCGLEEAADYISRVKETIIDTFEQHRKRNFHGNVSDEGTSRMSMGTGTTVMDIDGNSHDNSHESITELERYLTDDLVPREEGQGFDVLMWWKANSSRYPTVVSMARDALAMPASDMLSPEQIACIRSLTSSYCITYPQAEPWED